MTDDGDWLPLTSAQRGLFFAHELNPDSAACTTAEVVELETTLGAPLDVERFSHALDQVYARHEQLRVCMRLGEDGPVQRVLPGSSRRLEVIDLVDEAAADDWVARRTADPMDLRLGDVARTALIRLADGRTWWYHAAHHTVLDGYAYLLLARSVADAYSGRELDAHVVPSLADLVAEDGARDLDVHEKHWHRRLHDMAGLTNLAGAVADPAPGAIRASTEVAPDTHAAWTAAARRLGVQWADVVTAGMAAYVARLAPDLVDGVVRVGVPMMNRVTPGQPAHSTAHAVCTAMNVLPLAVETSSTTVAELVARVRSGTAEVREHPWVRQEDLARALRHGSREVTQLFGPQVNLLPFSPVLDFGGVKGLVRNVTAGPVEDMTWTVRGLPGRRGPVRCEVDANPRLYDAATVEATLERLLAWTVTFADASGEDLVADLPILTPDEHELVVHGFNDTAHPVDARTLADAFSAQVGLTPGAVALRTAGGDRWTYARLDEVVGQLADALVGAGVARNEPVGVALPRSPELFAAVHAVHRAGCPFVPLDLDLPEARVRSMAEDAGVRLVVTRATDAPALPPGLVPLAVDDLSGSGPSAPLAPSRRPPHLDDPAYILFTSGSTGRPKGVVVTHRAIDNRLAWMQGLHPLVAGDVVLHKTPVTFDVSVWELFWPLQVGATVLVAPPDAHRDPRHLASLVTDEQVDTLHFVPSMLQALLDDPTSVARLRGSAVRQLFCSGEALSGDLVRRSREAFGVAPINLYGPTEAAVDVTGWMCDPEVDGTVVPIGAPLWNVRTYVLDAQDRPQPVGVVGHLHLAGVQLASGYVNRPDLTGDAFVPDPFHPGERMYRTGDLARWRDDGTLVYEGRIDHQVKIRGQRVEPGEVERVLVESGLASAACVLALPGLTGASLEAFVVADASAVEGLRRVAEKLLPTHMVPRGIHSVAMLPVTTSGKVDRQELATQVPLREEHVPAEAPRDLLEEQIAQGMGAVVGGRVGPDEDFFDAGGNSLLAVRLLGELEAATGRPVSLIDVFEAPTPRQLAARLGHEAGERDDLAELLVLRAGAAGVAPLVTLPPAGGLGWCYAGLLRHLPRDQPVYAVQGRGMSADEQLWLPRSLDELAKRQLALIRSVVGDGPFHLLGWSIGGMAAHAVAARAIADGHDVGVVALLDAYPADQWRQLPEPSEQDRIRGLLRMGGAEHRVALDALLTTDRARELLLEEGSALAALPADVVAKVSANVLHSARLVRSSQHTRLDHDLLLFVAGAPRAEHWLSADAWHPHVSGVVVRHALDATHPDLVREPHIGAIAGVLLGRIAACADRRTH